jgi:predicted GNAT superfamily acetyltransferase
MSGALFDTPSGATIREVTTVEQAFEASAVLREVWGGDRDAMPANVVRALAHSGNYVVGLYDGSRMVGASIAFFAPPAERSMHSHVTGVLAGDRSRGLGRALKSHQREWALARGVGHITWTFDPLVARNAHVNLALLGTRVTEYLVDQYGAMNDGVNRGDETDRLMVSWALAAPPRPSPAPDRVEATVAVPRDIEGLRAESPEQAADWRHRVRDEFLRLLGDGLVVGGWDDALGYLFVRP